MTTIPFRPDPRISTSPPAWLTGPDWRDRLDTLDDADVDWIQDQWAAAGGPWHAPDDPDWSWTVPLILLVLPYTVVAICVEVLR